MASYANQKSIKINRIKVDNKQSYLHVQKDSLMNAALELNGVSFKLYMYFLCNKNDFELDFSPQHFVNSFGGTVRSTHDAFEELVKSGYLVPIEGRSKHYNFFETSVYYAKFNDAMGQEVFYSKSQLIKNFGSAAAEEAWKSSIDADGLYIMNLDDTYREVNNNGNN